MEECNALSQAEAYRNDWRETIIRYIKTKRNRMTRPRQSASRDSRPTIPS
jgi:transposase InsO family protein